MSTSEYLSKNLSLERKIAINFDDQSRGNIRTGLRFFVSGSRSARFESEKKPLSLLFLTSES